MSIDDGPGPRPVVGRIGRLGRGAGAGAAAVAAILGVAHAAVSAYWAAGGSALLDTVGGDIERWGRQRGAGVAAALWAITGLKLVVALAAPVLVGTGERWLPAWTRARTPRVLGWIAAIVLAVYGGVLAGAGLLVQIGAIPAGDGADRRALAWHAYLWDPWFALWGAAFIVALWRSSRRSM